MLFYFVFEGNFPSTCIWRGDLTEGFLRHRIWGLIFGGAYTWRGLFSEFYGRIFNFTMSVFCSNTRIFAPECWKWILRGPDYKIVPETHSFRALKSRLYCKFFLPHLLQILFLKKPVFQTLIKKVILIYLLQSHWMREPPCLQSMHIFQSRVLIFMLSLGLLWVPWATLCFAQWANGGVPVNLLVTGQACLHGWWLLLPEVPFSWRSPLVDKLLSCRCCCSQLRGDWRRRWLLWLCFPSRRNTFKKPEERILKWWHM